MTKQLIKTTNKKIASKVKKTLSRNPSDSTTLENFKSSVLVVSLLGNAFVLIGWLVVSITSQYDDQVAAFLFNL